MTLANNWVRAGIAAIVLLILLSLTLFTVDESQQAVVLRLGKIDRTYNTYRANRAFGATNTGLRPRIPFYEQVVMVDKRVQAVEMEQQQVLSTDQLRLQVDAFALFRIVDPRQMIQAVGQAQPVDRVKDALTPVLGSALRNELGKREFAALAVAGAWPADGDHPAAAERGRQPIRRADRGRAHQPRRPAGGHAAGVRL